MTSDQERNRLTARAARYARVGANVGGVAGSRVARTRLLGMTGQNPEKAAALAQALGGLKGPIMKVAQLLATIPEALPAEYAAELGNYRPGTGHGPALREAPHGGRTRPRLAATASRASNMKPPPPPPSARSIAPAQLTGGGSPANCNIPTCSRLLKLT